jgi:predicted transcriptional regulator
MNDRPTPAPELLGLTAMIVAAHVRGNRVSPGSLADLIRSVHKALGSAGVAPSTPARAEPAVPINRSVFADYIICLEDGSKLAMLKRRLKTIYGMTPEQYREKWDLPANYPMVAPNYAKRRSALAREIGLGRKPAATMSAVGSGHTPAKSAKAAPLAYRGAKRGRPPAKR